jgi:hypothetical protein
MSPSDQAASFPKQRRLMLWVSGAIIVSSAQLYTYAAGSGALLGLILTVGAVFLTPIAVTVCLQNRHQLSGRLRASLLVVTLGLSAAWVFQAMIVVYWLFFALSSDGFI